ncbi:translocation protein SEC62-like isoform X2 [Portunus trituberculatus]|uniref:translocation protein SEC62-like isoform X2 n=1 Tax=Portunus trituberculatus TaxID=210409 RepID=UPI001E1D1BC9|nr:translocation protein SEC62-like isoform X2 [Portunus trituberculatus]
MAKKRSTDIPVPVEEKPTKQEYAVATYLKKNCPTKKTKFLNHQVQYFYANKAIDILLDSQWASGKDILFTDRQSVVDYCNKLLKLKFFHRAKKIPITDKDLRPKDLKKKKEKEKEEKKKKDSDKKEKKEEKKEKEEKKNVEEDKDENEEEGEEESRPEAGTTDKEEKDGKDKEEEKEKKKKKKSKIKLDMHLEQVFVDGSDAYVWMYDPIPFWYYFVGALFLFGAIAVCLFPLWPPSVRKGVYYLSIAAAGFLGLILGLAVVRFIVFIIIWVLTMGVHHLWLLPNLTEDVGFFASFWPLYYYEYRGKGYEKKKKKKKKVTLEVDDDDQDKKSDGEDTVDGQDTAPETDKPETDADRTAGEEQTAASETDSENSNSQAFEMVEKEDVVEPEKGSCVEEVKAETSEMEEMSRS